MTHGRRAVKSACWRGASSPWVNRTVFAPPRLITLAFLGIASEFVTQGMLSITIIISILVALALLPLSLLHW
jgi:membrane-bound ClpP family serine protease